MAAKLPTVEVALDYPIDFKGKEITKIVLRMPRGDDLDFVPMQPKSVREMWPFVCLIGTVNSEKGEALTDELLGQLAAVDHNAVMETMGDFLKPKRGGQARRNGAR